MAPSLPLEIWSSIFDYIEGPKSRRKTQLAMITACRMLAHCDTDVKLIRSHLGALYHQGIQHLYRDLTTQDLLHPALLQALQQTPALASAVQSVVWTFHMEVKPVSSMSFDEDAIDPGDMDGYEEALVKSSIAASEAASDDRNMKCMKVLRLCSGITTLTVKASIDCTAFQDHSVHNYMDECTPFPTSEDLASLPFLTTLRQALFIGATSRIFIETPGAEHTWDWGAFKTVMDSCSVLKSLQVPAWSSFPLYRQSSVTKMVIQHTRQDWLRADSDDYTFAHIQATHPSLRTLINLANPVEIRQDAKTSTASFVSSAKIDLLSPLRRSKWGLNEWLGKLPLQMPRCQTLTLHLHRSTHTREEENTVADLTQIFDVMASSQSFASSLERLSVTVHPTTTPTKEIINNNCSNFISCHAYKCLLNATSFPRLQHISITNALDSRSNALQALGLDQEDIDDVYPAQYIACADLQLLDDFRKLVAGSRKDLVVEWNVEPSRGEDMWTAVTCMRRENGRITVRQDNSPETLKAIWSGVPLKG